jgi:hypothetical protein
MTKILSKINFWFLTLLLIYLPFSELLFRFLQKNYSLSTGFWLAHWYEPVLLVFVGFFILSSIFRRHFHLWRLTLLFLILLGIVSIFTHNPIARGFEGFRITLFFLLALFLNQPKDDNKINFLKNILIIVSLLIASWALFERLLPPKYWNGLFDAAAGFGFGYGFHQVGLIERSSSFLNGPIQLAAYLLPATFLALEKIAKNISNRRKAWPHILLLGLLILGAGFGFSRAAVGGLLASAPIFLFFAVKSWKQRFLLFGLMIAFAAIPLLYANFAGKSSHAVITHGTSQAGHVEGIQKSLDEIDSRDSQNVLFGGGLGTAGPLIFKYPGGMISESWYLQLILELGMVGLVLWVILMILLMIKLYHKKEFGLLGALLSVSLTALFLHTFADTPSLSLTLFLLIGLALNKEIYVKNLN